MKLFPQSTLLVQKAEYEWPDPYGTPRFPPGQPARKAEGDHDVFGDGSVMLISTPGHSPGHQCLLVKLPKTGAVLLTGDAVHTKANWDNKRAPVQNFNHAQSLAALDRMAAVLKENNAALWIGHEPTEVAQAQIRSGLLRMRFDMMRRRALCAMLAIRPCRRGDLGRASAGRPIQRVRSRWWCRCRPAARPISSVVSRRKR